MGDLTGSRPGGRSGKRSAPIAAASVADLHTSGGEGKRSSKEDRLRQLRRREGERVSGESGSGEGGSGTRLEVRLLPWWRSAGSTAAAPIASFLLASRSSGFFPASRSSGFSPTSCVASFW
ncbi:hypothetical protein TIFTF001_041973 [Ficus carica]|uniref:Uncharacterized protein n=1 Tax=Ficus carica TaxID=3494 RepID=A0AA88CVY6_FICCA|nr:hypothetical protein TIFTF001_041973 [Ficus carica]